MKNYKFSIIIPYYNTDINQTKQCLESIICQDLSLLNEIIVVNDGSDQNHAKQLNNLINNLNIKNYENKNLIKLINQKNQGQAAARKTGFYASSDNNTIISFVDSDDWIIDKNWLNKLNNYFSKNEQINAVIANNATFEKEKITTKKPKKIKTKIKNINLNWYINYRYWKGESCIVAIWKYAFKKEALIDQNFWLTLPLPHEDVYFHLYLLTKNYKALVTNEIFYCYRILNKNSITSSLSHTHTHTHTQIRK